MKSAVVILNWCGERHLQRFLPSVVEHTPVDVDIIVADNGSTDASSEVVLNYERVTWLELERNYGFAEGYNRALAQIDGDYDAFILLNSDVEVTPFWAEPLLALLEENDDVAAVAPKLRSVNEPHKFESAGASGGYIDYLGYPFCRGRVIDTVEVDAGQYDDVREVFWASGAAFCVRAKCFRELGGFDADFFAHMEEIDFCWRAQLAGYKIFICPESVVYHLGGGSLAVGSAFKVYLNHRNNLAMLFKCAPLGQRLVVAVVRPFLDLLTAFLYMLKGRFDASWAVFRAWATFIKWHGSLSRKRQYVRNTVVADSTHIYKGSILLEHILGRKKFSLFYRE